MPDPVALGFDTSAAHCAAALLRGDTVLAQASEAMTKGQAERLFPLLESLLSDAGLDWRDLDVIGVGIGPGNFTGIRIAVAAARGLALSLGIPAVGVTATEAAALGLPRPCRVVLPLRADQVVWQDFGTGAADRPQQAAGGSLPPGP
ncbi:tRNA (adenosine(37)-N6)-threonylcarbamoyltransferase complex dimerization subunit type 1 TsaB, partial [Paracoccus shandongensis]|uniref:tRNA (adenosine(37)-N6)-threonylcarbamoyltransferase complex dimerization subunit type 1 TsaB n=1 Tax=Paracoccus shandongensis TaxID=2816048 RepID=UPI001A8D4640